MDPACLKGSEICLIIPSDIVRYNEKEVKDADGISNLISNFVAICYFSDFANYMQTVV